MKRTISTERLFKLREYENIKFSDVIDELPEKVLLNQDLVESIRYLQFVEAELAFRRYIRLSEKLHHLSLEEAIPFLEATRENTLDEIKNIYQTTEEKKGE